MGFLATYRVRGWGWGDIITLLLMLDDGTAMELYVFKHKLCDIITIT